MTDMATGLGATASCPSCGAQVQVTDVPGPTATCPKCGTEVPTGVRDEVAEDVTMVEVIRAFEVNGYEGRVAVEEGDRLRCPSCDAVSPLASWPVDDRRRGSTQMAGDAPEEEALAVRCPSCDTPGVACCPAEPFSAC